VGLLTALASAEMDCGAGNAEMTDFATARAHATGMNIVFARQGYAIAGTLPNNTQINGDLESMNV
jgi:beta-lysine N6-acetyltransferase